MRNCETASKKSVNVLLGAVNSAARVLLTTQELQLTKQPFVSSGENESWLSSAKTKSES
jgi:hypothetical protein